MLKRDANLAYSDKKFTKAVQLYSASIVVDPHPIFYANRAAALLKRAWYKYCHTRLNAMNVHEIIFRDGDAYLALRDCHEAVKIDQSYVKAHLR